MSIIGVMLGVCVLIIVQSVMNGFGENIRARIVETHGDIRIRSSDVIDDWEEQIKKLEEYTEVLAVAPFAEGVIMLQHGSRPQIPMVRGIDPMIDDTVVPVRKYITLGDFEQFDDHGVFLGEGLAYALQAQPGSTVEVTTPLMMQRIKEDEILLPREFTVLGLFRTGSPSVDGNTMICTLRVMQELYGLGQGVHGLVVKLRPEVDAFAFAKYLESYELRVGLQPISWLEANQDFLFVIRQEKLVISFIIIFIILVASFSIAIALMMAVIRKTREIGLLIAMGALPRQVAYSFCLQGLVIGFLGTFLGVGLALMVLHFRVPIMSFYAQITGNDLNFLGIYDVYDLPVHYLLSDFIIVTLFAVIISTLAGLVPALRAALLNPADALRSE